MQESPLDQRDNSPGGLLVRTVGGHTGTVWSMAVAGGVLYISVGEPRSNCICAHHVHTGSLLRVLEEQQASLPSDAARFWAVARWARCVLLDSAGGRHRVLAGCGLPRKHDRICTIKYSICYIISFSSCWCFAINHTF